MKKTLSQLIADASRIKGEIEQIFIDADYWNKNVRITSEPAIDPDPRGELAHYLKGLNQFIEHAAKKIAERGDR